MKLYKQVSTKENPSLSGWYNTDKGKLFWFENETVWSCRDDRVSEEYPDVWYEEVEIDIEKLKELAHNGLPDDCIRNWTEVKFCENRQADGGACKHCSNYQ